MTILKSVPTLAVGDVTLPIQATPGSSGFDLRANLTAPIMLKPLERALVSSGLSIQLPIGYEAQVRPRSGLALKHGITVLNAPGTIDADYTGDIGVLLVNLSNTAFTVEPGARIAQLVFAKIEVPTLVLVDTLSQTSRGSGGFGSSGIN